MASQAFLRRRLRRRRNLPALVAPAAAAALALTLGAGRSATASAGAPEGTYAALASTEPSGLALVTSAQLRAGGDAGPSWPAQAPEGAQNWPVASTIRRVSLSTVGLSAWIARSSAGGVCILLYDGVPVDGVGAMYVGCSPPGRSDRGASVEVADIPGQPGEVIEAGVVPDGVTSVSVPLAGGSTSSTRVADNAWSRIGSEGAATGAETSEIRGG